MAASGPVQFQLLLRLELKQFRLDLNWIKKLDKKS
jgi:hypothetical protein